MAGILTLASCGSDGEPGASGGGDPIKWGVNAELSGPISFYGSSIAAGVKAYVDQVNAQGGIDGRRIELTQLDNAGDQSRSAANATQLITAEEVTAIFGQTLRTPWAAAAPVVERYKVPMACLSVAQSSDYVFNLGPHNPRGATAMLEAAKKVVGADKVRAASLMATTLTGKQLDQAIQAKAKDAGVDLVSTQQSETTATDVSAQVANIVAANPQVILVSVAGPAFLATLKGVRAAGVTAPFVWFDLTGSFQTMDGISDRNVYGFSVYQLVQPQKTTGAAEDFVNAIRPRIKGKPSLKTLNSGYAAAGYATARAFGEATKRCGADCTGEDLKKELEATDVAFEGLLPSFRYTATDHYPYRNWFVYRVSDNKAELTATFEAEAAAE